MQTQTARSIPGTDNAAVAVFEHHALAQTAVKKLAASEPKSPSSDVAFTPKRTSRVFTTSAIE